MNKELKLLYNTAFDLIENRLNKKEEIVPFTVVIEKDKGKPTVGMYELVMNDVNKQIEIIRKDLQKMLENREIEASCLCYSVNIVDPRSNKKVDSILFEMASIDTSKINIYAPYNFDDHNIIKKPFQINSD
ncbi:MAG: hypothetical protein WAX44_00190 [Minisyncoccia bacterium]